MPARAPSSASTTTPWSWAYSTTWRVIAMFSAKGLEEASIITEVKPPSMQLLQISKLSPWSRCRQMGRPVSMMAASTSLMR